MRQQHGGGTLGVVCEESLGPVGSKGRGPGGSIQERLVGRLTEDLVT